MSLEKEIDAFRFWDFTINEIYSIMTAYNKRKEEEAKVRAIYDYKQAILNISSVACALSNKAKFPEIYEVYSEFFNEEEQKQQDEEVMKARMLAYNEAWKSKKRGG